MSPAPAPSITGRQPAGIVARVPYAVHTDVFEGPFDVLLRLITEQRVDLYEVRLSDIVDGYLHELDLLERLDLEIATEFLLIAAILVEAQVPQAAPRPRRARERGRSRALGRARLPACPPGRVHDLLGRRSEDRRAGTPGGQVVSAPGWPR